MNFIINVAVLLSMMTVASNTTALQDTSRALEDEAAIHGTVKDPNGAVIAGASVRMNRIAENGNSSGVAPESGRQRSVATNVSGQFSVKLPAGSYQVCVTAFKGLKFECQNIKVAKGQDVTADFSSTLDPVWEKEHGRADSEVMDQRLRALAGAAAIDCGHVQVKASPASATKCAIRAFRHGKPFVVQYDIAAIESGVAGGLASNGNGDVYGVEFDGMGMSDDLKDGETMPDGSHTVVMPCPRPTKIRVNKRGRATCFKKKSRNPLWLLDEE